MKMNYELLRDWHRIDLRHRENMPKENQLVALHMEPLDGKRWGYNAPQYEVGYFKMEGRKWYWHRGPHSCSDPVTMKRNYEIWWTEMPLFDGMPY
jgi:hypothetical protein